VFTEGMGVPAHIEVDGLDGQCGHVLAWSVGEAVGTARLRVTEGRAKVERVAVLASCRGQGLGARLMEAVEELAAAQGHAEVYLHAQVAVVGFYERLGYTAEGPKFLEADIWHQTMSKGLTPIRA
jgi:predicted GNAT family N-acyltransferase